MTTEDLFKRLTEANFSFTKPCNAEEIIFLNEQKKSMDKLIICGLVEEVSTNKYSLSADGRKAKILGVKKWAESLTDIERRVLVYDFFEFFNNWYSLPRLKIRLERSIKSKISKEIWGVISAIIMILVGYFIKKIFNIEL
ncbi:hypothetical protein DNC80_13090 [Flavobacterium sp. SOK18b]|uniref:hypothetical protein n=1 Tax=Flavobacterium sp. SOK18b TaxID=797900 RepID=UPI0015FCD5AA|nr:hypothetical protein [Flavobacterium sp. SOK18b]MBB1194599.1 hypothetical protein [Flavobacterium sp. SOK18b]